MKRSSLFRCYPLAVVLSIAPWSRTDAQLSISATATNYTINFDGTVSNVGNGAFAGTGFEPGAPPTVGRLSSDAWAVTGWSNGNLAFGGTQTTAATDYTRGASAVAVTTGGIYAFSGGSITGVALGFQPGGADWAPGTVTLRLQNNTGTNISDLAVSYVVHVRDDQGRGNSFNFSWSADNTVYNPVAALDLTSNQVGTVGNPFVANNRSTTITGLNVPPGAFFYLRWSGADVNGSGSRDEFALDDIVVNAAGTPVANTIVQFTSASSTVSEGVGTTNLTLSIINPSTTQSTSVDVAISAGSAARVNNYTTQTVTFPANSSANESLTITVTDDAVYDGGGTVTFSLQNLTGGQGSPAIGTPSSHALTITENELSPLVINEVDYDMPGANDSLEFVEIYNGGITAIDLNGFVLQLVNGNAGGAAVYSSTTLPSFSLAPGGYYVVGNDASIPNINLVTGTNTNFIQNGSPDAVALRDPSNALIDAVSYEGNTGAPYTEGTGIAIGNSDDATDGIGISRFPNGADTQDNSADWSRRCISPGAANNSTNANCICSSPEATAISQCVDNSSWEIVVSVSSTGSGSTVDITNNVNGSSALGVGVGNHTIGPFPNNVSVNVTVEHETFPQCDLLLSGYFMNCQPDCNGVVGGPDVPGAPCDDNDAGTENDVWSPGCICAGTPIAPTVGFTLPSITVLEDGVLASVGVTMNTAPSGTVVVNVTDDLTGSATSGTDYGAVGTVQVTYLPTDAYPYTQLVNVSITDDPDYEPVESVDLSLAIFSGPANTGTTDHLLQIISNDQAPLRLNEVDYDNLGTDNAEWLELKNTGSSAIDLAGFSVVLVNGNGGGAAVYKTIVLPSFSLAAGGYYVIGNNAAIPNLDLLQTPATDMIQNGSPDAIGLFDPASTLIDAVSYEGNTGAPYTEGTGTGVTTSDDNVTAAKVIARYLDGNDTNDNSVDWKAWCATPGVSNATVDADGDATADCLDGCPNDPNKIAPGICGCGVSDADTDGDLTADCNDGCPLDPNKIAPGICGCGTADTDTDGDSTPDCNDNCPNVSGQIGSPCDDGDENTSNDELDAFCVCAGTPLGCEGNEAVLTIQLDAAPGDVTWQILDDLLMPVAGGGPYPGQSGQLITEGLCLPSTFGDCYSLALFDSGGDGILGGSWELRDGNGELVIRDNGTYAAQSPNAPPAISSYTAHRFCLPLGPSAITTGSCGVFNSSLFAKVFAEEVGGAVTYQFEFSDPNAGFLRRIAVPRPYVKYSEMQTSPLTPGVVYFCRVRVDQGASGFADDAFGPGCELGMDPSANNPCTQLIDDPDQPSFSCGATKTFGGSDKIWARPVSGATSYRFRFVHAASSFARNIQRPSYVCPLSWVTAPLQPGLTYDVTVEVLVNNVWSGFCGNTCPLTIAQPPAQMSEESAPTLLDPIGSMELAMWPNPNNSGTLFLAIDRLDASVTLATLDIFDAFGQRLSTRSLAVTDGVVNTSIALENSLSPGLYLVTITAGNKGRTERLMIH